MKTHRSTIIRGITAIAASALLAVVPVALSADVDYLREIKPVLKERCYGCHGALKQKAGLRLDTVLSMRKGGRNGDILAVDGSVLLKRITSTDPKERMPPEGEGAPLNKGQVAQIEAWIRGGPSEIAGESPQADPRQHWAYTPPRRSDGDIDSLLAARQSARGLKQQAEATPETWLRRAYFTLIGLPPTPEEIRAFERASIPDGPGARSAVVEALLGSAAYGERWGRHFMDIWRYSDWYGLDPELRNSQKHIWRWRDWIIESLNADKGYDRMLQEMLAGDELEPENPEVLRATGFLARNYYIFNRTSWLDDVIEHTSRALLGTTMQCVKCHDHKYDPIEQVEYYRMRAIFEPYHVRLDAVPGVCDFEKDGLPRVYDMHLDQVTYRHVRGDEKNEDKSKPISPAVPAALGGSLTVHPVPMPALAIAPGMIPANRRALARQASQRVAEARMALTGAKPEDQPLALKQLELAEAELASLRARSAADEARHVNRNPSESLDSTAARAERLTKVLRAEIEVMKADRTLTKARSDAKAGAKAGAEAVTKAEKALADARTEAQKARDALARPGRNYPSVSSCFIAKTGYDDTADHGAIFPAYSTGRRLAFARWLTETNHPLTARVLVNHVWTRHFGASFVPDASDFGVRCPPPLHQDLLDSLAVDFMEHGWSLKRLHRQLVLSRLFRTRSSNAGADAATLEADPDNACYWRMNPRRLESQAVRDALLFVAGRLDLTQGGPSVDSKNDTSTRRALYFVQTPDLENRFLGVFDNANVLDCYRRQESIVPQQALALANSKLSRECSESLAARLASLDETAFIQESFLTTLGRRPSAAEIRACTDGLAKLAHTAGGGSEPKRARALFLQSLFNHNDFITLR